MTYGQPLSKLFYIQLLEKLGNKKPKKEEIKLLESLLLTTCITKNIFLNQRISPREADCLLLAAKGKTVEESAKLMNVSLGTARTFRNKILKKLDCHSMAQAVFKGIQYGYIAPELETDRT